MKVMSINKLNARSFYLSTAFRDSTQ